MGEEKSELSEFVRYIEVWTVLAVLMIVDGLRRETSCTHRRRVSDFNGRLGERVYGSVLCHETDEKWAVCQRTARRQVDWAVL